jgi:gliding motility-associated-like protein
MTIKITGGTEPYILSLNDDQYLTNPWKFSKSTISDTTTVKLSDQGINLATDITYKFYMKDANNCHIQNIAGLRENYEPFADTLFLKPDSILLTGLKSKPIKCGNDKTGVIEFTAKVGNKEYITDIPPGYMFTAINTEESRNNYSKSNDPGVTSVNGLFAGKHECTLVDKYGCVAATKLTDNMYEPNSSFWGIDTVTIFATYDSIQVTIDSILNPKCDFWYDGFIQVNVNNYREDGVKYIVERWDSAEVRFKMDERNWTDTILAEPGCDNGLEDLLYKTCVPEKIVEDIGIGLYRITVRDLYTECEAIIHEQIYSIDGDSCPQINYYNAFTPLNNDGYYDEWEIYGSQYQTYTLQIYTALGELIYSEEGVSGKNGIKWNGLDKWGRPAPVGTYIYLLRKFAGTEKEVLIDGNITILRSNGR